MIVELFGLPASGKSTLTDRVAKESGWVCLSYFYSKTEVLFYWVAGLILNPLKLIVGLVFAILYARNFSLFWNCYFVKYAKFYKAYLTKNKHCLINEGPYQNIISFSRHKSFLKHINFYIKYLPKSDKIVILNIDEAVRLQRDEERINAGHKSNKERTDSEVSGMIAGNKAFSALIKNNAKYSIFNELDSAYRYICNL